MFALLHFEPMQIFCTDCLLSHTWLVFEGNVEKMTHEREFRVQEAKTRRQLAMMSWTDMFMKCF